MNNDHIKTKKECEKLKSDVAGKNKKRKELEESCDKNAKG